MSLRPAHRIKRWRPIPLERHTHIAVADLLRRLCREDVHWTHIASGEYRTSATAALLYRMGVTPGWPDFLFIDQHGVAFLELKRKGGRLTPAQEKVRNFCEQHGIRYAVAWSYEEAAEALQGWGFLERRLTLF